MFSLWDLEPKVWLTFTPILTRHRKWHNVLITVTFHMDYRVINISTINLFCFHHIVVVIVCSTVNVWVFFNSCLYSSGISKWMQEIGNDSHKLGTKRHAERQREEKLLWKDERVASRSKYQCLQIHLQDQIQKHRWCMFSEQKEFGERQKERVHVGQLF